MTHKHFFQGLKYVIGVPPEVSFIYIAPQPEGRHKGISTYIYLSIYNIFVYYICCMVPTEVSVISPHQNDSAKVQEWELLPLCRPPSWTNKMFVLELAKGCFQIIYGRIKKISFLAGMSTKRYNLRRQNSLSLSLCQFHKRICIHTFIYLKMIKEKLDKTCSYPKKAKGRGIKFFSSSFLGLKYVSYNIFNRFWMYFDVQWDTGDFMKKVSLATCVH